MLAIVDRPLIQYAVDGAREAGIEQMIFVTGRGKTAIVEHFDIAYELESTMSERGKDMGVLDATRATPGDIITVRQQVPLGLGHAIWCARAIVGEEPFAIFLPDERSEEHTSELQSLMRISYAVFCLKKKKPKQRHTQYTNHPAHSQTQQPP